MSISVVEKEPAPEASVVIPVKNIIAQDTFAEEVDNRTDAEIAKEKIKIKRNKRKIHLVDQSRIKM